MSRLILTIAVEDAAVGPQGAKEAVSMALEPLGGVQVLSVNVQEPEQLALNGAAPARPAVPARRAEKAAPRGQARTAPPSGHPKPYIPKEMPCCLSCASFRPAWKGYGEPGQLHYGKCQDTNKPVHSLSARCGAWKEAQQE